MKLFCKLGWHKWRRTGESLFLPFTTVDCPDLRVNPRLTEPRLNPSFFRCKVCGKEKEAAYE